MGIRSRKPTSPARRFQTVSDFSEITKDKPEIADAVEAIWGVEVLKVNTLNRPGKRRRTRGSNRIGHKPDTKRAIVTLAAGQTIDLFQG